MKRVAAVAGLIVVALVIWWLRRGDSEHAASKPPAPTTARAAGVVAQQRLDPTKLVRASIAGVVTDETHAPIANARVCATGRSHDLDSELLHAFVCATTDATGTYTLANLLPATYAVGASARTFRPDAHHPGGDPKQTDVRLAAGQQQTGIDIVLRAGGVEMTGVVLDLTGGPIEGARVSSHGTRWQGTAGSIAMTETAADGTFSLWVGPGPSSVSASADGYADAGEWVFAPGKVEILLTPDSTLAGTVVDAASGAPVAGARVTISGEDTDRNTFSDEAGAFRFARLTPGRFTTAATTEHGFGYSEGSTLVGLGQAVDGVVVKLHAAVRVEGKVVTASTKQPCAQPNVTLADGAQGRWVDVRTEPDGRAWAEGVLPGKYAVEVQCDGYRAKDSYEAVVVADKDVTGLVWEVEPGAKVTGRVLSKAGQPIEDARVSARMTGGAARDKGGWGYDRTLPDGTYTLSGLRAGMYKLEVSTHKGAAPADGYKVEVKDGATVQQDLVLEETGTIKGTVVDGDGKPVAGVEVNTKNLSGTTAWSYGNNNKSDENGAFTLEGLKPGEYKVVAARGWSTQLRRPGTTDNTEQGERVTVRANQPATVRLVIEAQTGVITGTVVDAAGAPVSDAFISAARESDAAGAQQTASQQTRWSFDDKPVLTNTDGTFTLTKLSPGNYTVRAHRKGGGEAFAEHVAVGGTATLKITPVGSISGTVAGGAEEVRITLRDPATGYTRHESFFRTAGRYTLADLPKGKFQLSASAAIGSAQTEIALAEGERKTDVNLTLARLVTLTGRVVIHGTTTGVAGMIVYARPALGGASSTWSSDDDREFITDEQGRFTIKNVQTGKLALRGYAKAGINDSAYAPLSTVRTVTGSGTVDVGDLPVLKKRLRDGEPAGKLGIRFAEPPPTTAPDARALEISWLDPTGPAAKSELAVGDVITSVDGIDVTGGNIASYASLIRAPPGTKLSFGTKRGATVIVVLTAP